MPRLNKQEIVAYQASARGGWLRLRLAGDRVKLRGQAVTTLRGELVARGKIDAFFGVLAGKSKKIATIEEMNEAAREGWAGKL
jgi:hypothetical protein